MRIAKRYIKILLWLFFMIGDEKGGYRPTLMLLGKTYTFRFVIFFVHCLTLTSFGLLKMFLSSHQYSSALFEFPLSFFLFFCFIYICIFILHNLVKEPFSGFFLPHTLLLSDQVINHRISVAQEHVSVFVLWHRPTEKKLNIQTTKRTNERSNTKTNEDTSHRSPSPWMNESYSSSSRSIATVARAGTRIYSVFFFFSGKEGKMGWIVQSVPAGQSRSFSSQHFGKVQK